MKKKSLIVTFLLVIGLVSITLGVTYAFFNYTRTGTENTLSVGRIYFNHTQDGKIELSNIFPTSSSNLNSTNSDTVTINITGDTTYSGGIEYKVTLEDVNNTINGKEIPISFNVTANNLGTKSNDYWNERGSTTNIYNLEETGEVEDGKYVLVGYIKPDASGVNGSIDITAYVDTDRVAISDTVSRIDNGNFIYGETTGDWIAGRTVLTTEEWNSFSSSPISFKVKVEANEGIWVEEEKFYVMQNIYGIQAWKNVRDNITSIEFHKDGIAPLNPVATIDVTDVTSKGTVTLYTVDDELGTNTYKAIVVADDTIYAPVNSQGLFSMMRKLTEFNSQNFQVDNVTNMRAFFGRDFALENIQSLSQWNTKNVNTMKQMFTNCINLTNLSSLINWNTSNVTDMNQMFANCTNLTNVNSLINWDTSNVTDMYGMFGVCNNLANINGLINWNVSNVKDMTSMFENSISIQSVDALVNWNVSNVTNMQIMFNGCTSLTSVNGLVNWNVSNVTNMQYMFNGCTSLTSVNGLVNWNVSNVTNMQAMFANCSNLTDFNSLANWNTSSVTDMSNMFSIDDSDYASIFDATVIANWNTGNVTDMSGMFCNRSVSSYLPFKNWNVGNVQDFNRMFNATSSTSITTLSGLENWDVSSATNMEGMFWDNVSLTDASAINNWNINANINFTYMFINAPVHPEFTKVSGTWDSEGTFTPNS